MHPVTRSYEIHEAAALTGLTPARLRAWERRYDAVRPARQPNGYRAYSSEQVALLRAFSRLVAQGARIGSLAAMEPADVITAATLSASDGTPLGEILDAVRALDRERLEALIAEQVALLGLAGFAREIVLPLATIIGDLWSVGELPVVAEHFASEAVVRALKNGLLVQAVSGPTVICACLPGERHEWGFLATLTGVQNAGWRAHYLGADLPLDELVHAAWQLRPAGVVLTVGDPGICQASLASLLALPARLPERAFAAIGGAGVAGHETALRAAGFRLGVEAFGVAGPTAKPSVS